MISINQSKALKGSHTHFLMKGLTVLKPNHPTAAQIIARNNNPAILGSRIWPSSYLLVEYLSKQIFSREQRILELGCGWGLASTYLKKRFGTDVTAFDCDWKVLAFQKLLSGFNDLDIDFKLGRFSELTDEDLSPIDVMIGSEICYSYSIAQELEHLIHRFAAQGGKEIILADRGRSTFSELQGNLRQYYPLQVIDLSIELPMKNQGKILHIRLKT